jgi:cytochrome c oxidase assembly factor CtaG
VRAFLRRVRPWLAPAAVVLLLSAALPPAGTYARYYESAQALQFVIFAVAGPALLILSRPRAGSLEFFWRLPDWAGPRARRAPAGQPTGRAAAAKLLAFMALVITWRLPAVRNALAADPVLALAELVTLAAAGSGVWLELAGPGHPRQPLSRPLRAAMAAAAMWTLWIIAYVTGLSHASQTAAHGGTAGALSAAADQQIAIAIMWAVPAICFVPVIYALVISWLGEREDPARQSAITPPAGAQPRPVSLPRPPRGWRSPPGPDPQDLHELLARPPGND